MQLLLLSQRVRGVPRGAWPKGPQKARLPVPPAGPGGSLQVSQVLASCTLCGSFLKPAGSRLFHINFDLPCAWRGQGQATCLRQGDKPRSIGRRQNNKFVQPHSQAVTESQTEARVLLHMSHLILPPTLCGKDEPDEETDTQLNGFAQGHTASKCPGLPGSKAGSISALSSSFPQGRKGDWEWQRSCPRKDVGLELSEPARDWICNEVMIGLNSKPSLQRPQSPRQ